jgi:hypothetical protein
MKKKPINDYKVSFKKAQMIIKIKETELHKFIVQSNRLQIYAAFTSWEVLTARGLVCSSFPIFSSFLLFEQRTSYLRHIIMMITPSTAQTAAKA